MRPEWEVKARRFFDTRQATRMLDTLHSNLAMVERLSSLGQWDSNFVIPRLISPIRDASVYDYAFETAKFVSISHPELLGKKCFEVNAGFGLSMLVAGAFDVDMAGSFMIPKQMIATTLGGVLNDVVIPDHTMEESDVVIFSRCFYEKEMAKANMAKARELRAAGKRVIIASLSIWKGMNEWVKLQPDEASLLVDTVWLDPRFVFELV